MNIDIIVIACSTLNVPKLIHKQVYKVSCLFIRFSLNVVSGKWIINLHNWLMKKKIHCHIKAQTALFVSR